MDQFPQMLYRAGGSEQHHGGNFDTLVVHDEIQHANALATGWSETTTDALQVALPKEPVEPVATAAPTREELEQKATELGVDFKGNWGDKRLAAAIADKLAG